MHDWFRGVDSTITGGFMAGLLVSILKVVRDKRKITISDIAEGTTECLCAPQGPRSKSTSRLKSCEEASGFERLSVQHLRHQTEASTDGVNSSARQGRQGKFPEGNEGIRRKVPGSLPNGGHRHRRKRTHNIKTGGSRTWQKQPQTRQGSTAG